MLKALNTALTTLEQQHANHDHMISNYMTCVYGTLQPFVQLLCQCAVPPQHLRLLVTGGCTTSRAQGRQLIRKQAAREKGAGRSGKCWVPLLVAVSQEIQQQMLCQCIAAISFFCACWQTRNGLISQVVIGITILFTELLSGLLK